MAIIKIHKNSKIRLVLNAGLDDNNKQITKYKTMDKARSEAEDEVLFDIAKKAASLQKHSLTNIIKYEEYMLLEQ
ncbi:DUF1659 domain-containing protein [Sedimentibacter hydroxybenzoicus DSM 7310]|uniref:DUF1659 domain-containing protein n=1 Tax=Sedimentibacter hydroxybenzoicus DSM 7310 TaxID=1123245 RepID=A0A974BHA5_SEDHY|nr:DUF1659 domain-containing protein [Sedimentibacter hydroxybenzoicus]NYB72827.1 DUF1659 domain-containing protein [Sedimentibacter hydroxybenzoicus DSM 7310]